MESYLPPLLLSWSLMFLPCCFHTQSRNAATVVMVDSQRTAMPVKTHISNCEDGDSTLYVVNVEKSTWEEGLDERRLALVIDFAGEVQHVSV